MPVGELVVHVPDSPGDRKEQARARRAERASATSTRTECGENSERENPAEQERERDVNEIHGPVSLTLILGLE